jgi:hypothetical protein
MKRVTLVTAFAIVACLWAAVANAAAIPITAVTGDAFIVTVMAGADVTDFDLQIVLPAELRATEVSLGSATLRIGASDVLSSFILTDASDPIDPLPNTTQFDLAGGLTGAFDVIASLDHSLFVSGPWALFSINIVALAAFDGSLDLLPSAFLADPSDPSLFNGLGQDGLPNPVGFETVTASLEAAQPVPEPATLTLLGAGLIVGALPGARRRRAQKLQKM